MRIYNDNVFNLINNFCENCPFYGHMFKYKEMIHFCYKKEKMDSRIIFDNKDKTCEIDKNYFTIPKDCDYYLEIALTLNKKENRNGNS